jgi:hypothetical protein
MCSANPRKCNIDVHLVLLFGDFLVCGLVFSKNSGKNLPPQDVPCPFPSGDAMPTAKTSELLQKISFIEADIEIHRQILVAIASDQVAEMEKTIAAIADKKSAIATLREDIRRNDPDTHEKIVAFERVSAEFRRRAATGAFVEVISGHLGGDDALLPLADGSSCPCLVKARDAQGNWTIITPDGELKEFTASGTELA